MIYTAHDIINQALHLANLNNTDFLTYKEKMDYINSSFEAIYNSAINHDDLYWLKEVKIKGTAHDSYTDYILPSDFYQLRIVKSGNTTIPRKSATEHKNGYEVINGNLRIYGYHADVDVQYFPKPPFITFTQDKVYLDITDVPSTGFGHLIAIGNNIYDINNNTYSEITGDIILVGNNQILVKQDDDYFIAIYSDSWKYIPIEEFDYPVLTYTGNIYVARGKSIYSFTNKEICSFEEIEHPTTNGLLNTEHNMLVVGDNYKLKVLGRDVDVDIDIDGDKIIPIDWQTYDAFMFENKGIIYDMRITPEVEIDIVDVDSQVTPILLQGNKNTGYGILGFDGNIYITGYMPETVLDYPNNLFYRAIASDLAVAFLQKQGGDVTPVATRAATYITNFMRSLDSNSEYTRIKNIY